MTAKSRKKSKRAQQSSPAQGGTKTATKRTQWHGIKLASRTSAADLKLLRVLLSGKLQNSSECPLDWLLNPIFPDGQPDVIRKWQRTMVGNRKGENSKTLRRLANDVITSVQQVDVDLTQPGDALLVLGACHAIRAIAGHCEFEDWTALVEKLMQIANVAESNVPLAPAVYQWLAIEVPLTIAFQIPETEDSRRIGEQACQRLAVSIAEMLDTDGWPNSKFISEFGPLAASWVRCYTIASKIGIEAIYQAASQIEWMVRQVLRMRRPDGTLVFSDAQSLPISDAFLAALLKLTQDPNDQTLLTLFRTASTSSTKPDELPEPGNLSEWGQAAVLQSHWGRTSPKLAIDFSGQRCRIEIARRVSLIQGDAMPIVSIDGQPQSPQEGFSVACHESDDDVDYLEIQMQLTHCQLTRQILLSREEEFLLIADIIVPIASSQIQYHCDWHYASGIVGLRETETREGYLRDQKIQALILPLALPEWKAEKSPGQLEFHDQRARLLQSCHGAGLYAPLFFDLSPKRSRKKRTWRQLTVGEQRKPVPRDVACGFRVQLNKQQWFFYRTISSKGYRTFLGENFGGEFVFNRFQKKGTVTKLIEIQ